MAIKWETTDAEVSLIAKIAKRAIAMARDLERKGGRDGNRLGFDGLDIQMDIAATHLNGCPLRLEGLLAADDFNFAHDVWGIRRHLDRETGRLQNHFLPRFSAPGKAQSAL